MRHGGRPARLRGALALDPAAYQDIADDPKALPGALLVVVVATLLAGLGGLLWTQWGGRAPAQAIYQTDVTGFVRRSVIVGGVIQVALWGVLVAVTVMYLRAFGEAAPFGRLARALGYAFAPMGLQLFIAPPGLELAVAAVALGFTFCAMVVGAQAATSATPGRALVSVLAGFALFVAVLSLLGNGAADVSAPPAASGPRKALYGLLGDATTDLAPGIFSLDSLPTSVSFRSGP